MSVTTYPDDFVGPLPEGAMRESEYNQLIWAQTVDSILLASLIMCGVIVVAGLSVMIF